MRVFYRLLPELLISFWKAATHNANRSSLVCGSAILFVKFFNLVYLNLQLGLTP